MNFNFGELISHHQACYTELLQPLFLSEWLESIVFAAGKTFSYGFYSFSDLGTCSFGTSSFCLLFDGGLSCLYFDREGSLSIASSLLKK